MQATILPLGFVFGLLQPLWPSTADALARNDHHWLRGSMRRGRALVLGAGGIAFLVVLLFGERLLHLWLRRPLALDWPVRAMMGVYLLLAIWEYYHFVMALGFGRLREATTAVFQRSAVFAIAVPLLAALGGPAALWFGMCCSIALWTMWRLPRLLHAQTALEDHRCATQ
jgi:O-antigen/teichoic acid export membrane protein